MVITRTLYIYICRYIVMSIWLLVSHSGPGTESEAKINTGWICTIIHFTDHKSNKNFKCFFGVNVLTYLFIEASGESETHNTFGPKTNPVNLRPKYDLK